MTIKLVAIDLDDTLLDSNLNISAANRDILAKVRELGVMVTLATGRMFRSARPYAVDLEMNIPLITYQGALVKNAFSDEVLYYRPVPGGLAQLVTEEAKKMGHHYQTYFDDHLYMEKLTSEGRAYAELAGVVPVIEPDLQKKVEVLEPTKIIVIHDDLTVIRQAEDHMRRMFGDRLYVTRSKPHFLEILNPEATKGLALQAVAASFGFQQTQVMAIGDSYNDIDMLEWAGTGVAVANAPDPVKKAANYVTRSNDDNGVAEALRRSILEEA